jgi:hypothetical protein
MLVLAAVYVCLTLASPRGGAVTRRQLQPQNPAAIRRAGSSGSEPTVEDLQRKLKAAKHTALEHLLEKLVAPGDSPRSSSMAILVKKLSAGIPATIVVFGGSISAGHGTAKHDWGKKRAWPRLLQDWLIKNFPISNEYEEGLTHRVVNAAVQAQNACGLMVEVTAALTDALVTQTMIGGKLFTLVREADLIVVETAVNDALAGGEIHGCIESVIRPLSCSSN